MASIRRELVVSVDPRQVWDAIRDVGAIHARVARGFVADTVLEGWERLVTFANGFTVHERIVTVDDPADTSQRVVRGPRRRCLEVANRVDDGSCCRTTPRKRLPG